MIFFVSIQGSMSIKQVDRIVFSASRHSDSDQVFRSLFFLQRIGSYVTSTVNWREYEVSLFLAFHVGFERSKAARRHKQGVRVEFNVSSLPWR